MDRVAWQAIYSPWGCKNMDTIERSTLFNTYYTNLLLSLTKIKFPQDSKLVLKVGKN